MSLICKIDKNSNQNPALHYSKIFKANYVLSKELGLNHKYFSISLAIIQDKKNYYISLEKTNKSIDNKGFSYKL